MPEIGIPFRPVENRTYAPIEETKFGVFRM